MSEVEISNMTLLVKAPADLREFILYRPIEQIFNNDKAESVSLIKQLAEYGIEFVNTEKINKIESFLKSNSLFAKSVRAIEFTLSFLNDDDAKPVISIALHRKKPLSNKPEVSYRLKNKLTPLVQPRPINQIDSKYIRAEATQSRFFDFNIEASIETINIQLERYFYEQVLKIDANHKSLSDSHLTIDGTLLDTNLDDNDKKITVTQNPQNAQINFEMLYSAQQISVPEEFSIWAQNTIKNVLDTITEIKASPEPAQSFRLTFTFDWSTKDIRGYYSIFDIEISKEKVIRTHQTPTKPHSFSYELLGDNERLANENQLRQSKNRKKILEPYSLSIQLPPQDKDYPIDYEFQNISYPLQFHNSTTGSEIKMTFESVLRMHGKYIDERTINHILDNYLGRFTTKLNNIRRDYTQDRFSLNISLKQTDQGLLLNIYFDLQKN